MGAVLIIHDNDDIRDSIAELLTTEGYEVVTAKNAAEGLRVASHLRLSLILLDLRMPNMDGRQFRDRPRAREGMAATIDFSVLWPA